MEENKPIDGAEYITLEDGKRLKLPYFESVAAGFPSPAGDYEHESLDLNEKFVHHTEASYFVRVRGESMIGLGILDGDIDSSRHQKILIMYAIINASSVRATTTSVQASS